MISQQQLVLNCQKTPARKAWLENLPRLLKELTDRWSLHLDHPLSMMRQGEPDKAVRIWNTKVVSRAAPLWTFRTRSCLETRSCVWNCLPQDRRRASR